MEIAVDFRSILWWSCRAFLLSKEEIIMTHLQLFALAVMMAALSGCISLGSSQPGPPGPKGDSSSTTVVVPQKD